MGHADAAKRAETLQELLSKEAATRRSGSLFFLEECHQYTLIYIQIYSNIYNIYIVICVYIYTHNIMVEYG